MSFFTASMIVIAIFLAPHFTKDEAVSSCWILIAVETVMILVGLLA
jgi:hypothetical protein